MWERLVGGTQSATLRARFAHTLTHGSERLPGCVDLPPGCVCETSAASSASLGCKRSSGSNRTAERPSLLWGAQSRRLQQSQGSVSRRRWTHASGWRPPARARPCRPCAARHQHTPTRWPLQRLSTRRGFAGDVSLASTKGTPSHGPTRNCRSPTSCKPPSSSPPVRTSGAAPARNHTGK